MTIQPRLVQGRLTVSLLKASTLKQGKAARAQSMESVSIQHVQRVHGILLRKQVGKIRHQMGTQKSQALKKALN